MIETVHPIRLATFNWLEEKTTIIGDVLPRNILEEGFTCQNQKITLLGVKGIWKPKVMELPLSISTISNGPYDDAFSDDGLLIYRYLGKDPFHRDNRSLSRLA